VKMSNTGLSACNAAVVISLTFVAVTYVSGNNDENRGKQGIFELNDCWHIDPYNGDSLSFRVICVRTWNKLTTTTHRL